MKTLVRTFALSLVLTGAFASTHLSSGSDAVHGKVSALPVPICPPDNPNGCGIYGPPPPPPPPPTPKAI
jgi:hypothetical protein